MNDYPFLVLSLLFLIPGMLFYALRPDIRRLLRLTVLASLPFATTEFLFYPTYWEPRTLFDLVPRIGFGIEDLLFVSGLGLITAGVFPILSGKTVAFPRVPGRQVAARVIAIATPTAVAVAASALIGIPLIYAAPVIMVIAAVIIALLRRDLAVVALVGAAGTLIIYTGLSLIYEMLLPGVFELNWNTDAFSDRFILGIPMEELLYGASAGGVGSIVVVFVLGGTFVKRSQPDAR